MRTATAPKANHSQTEIGRMLARRGVDMYLAMDDDGVLLQCHVSSAIAAAMLAPLKGKAAGQFRPLPGNLVEIDAAVTLPMARRMLAAKSGAEARFHLN
jgi:hypothetical protein